MSDKPTPKQLQRRAKELERENILLTEANEQLRESEEKFKTIFENANDEIAYIGIDGTIIDVNDRVEDITGYSRQESIGKKFYEFGALSPDVWQEFIELTADLLAGKTRETHIMEIEIRGKAGKRVCAEVNPRVVKKGGEISGVLVIIRDISDRKKQEELLRKHRDDLERLVNERTMNLGEANAALKIMLQKAEEVKAELEDKILFNVKEFILPYLEKLRKSNLDPAQEVYLNSLEENLNEMTSPFLHGISTKYLKLTPTEIRIANMVKQGKTSKEISDLLNMSARTIDTHRYNIRVKLGIKNQKINLRTHLLSFQ